MKGLGVMVEGAQAVASLRVTASAGGCASVWYTTQYRSVRRRSVASCSSVASVSSVNCSRMFWNPTGTSLDRPSVPRKSRSPSAWSEASRNSTPSAAATALSVTPAQATRASSSMSPEQAACPLPPVAGCNPATTSALPVSILQLTPSPMRPCARRVISAASGASR